MKILVKTTVAFLTVGLIIVACKKENVEKAMDNQVVQENNRTPDEIDPVPYGPNLLVTFVNSDLPVVNPSACGGRAQQVSCGSFYTLEVHVTNIGNAPTTDYYDLHMDKPTGNTTSLTRISPSNSLAPGATDVYIIGPASFGGCSGSFSTQELIFTADYYNAIAETDETDNTARPYRYCGD